MAWGNGAEALSALETALAGMDPDDLRALARAAPDLARTARTLAAPEITELAPRLVAAMHDAEHGPAPTFRSLLKQAPAPRIRRGMGVALSLLRGLGRGTGHHPAPARAAAPPPVRTVRTPSDCQVPAPRAPRAQAYGETPEQAQGAVMQQLGQAGLDLAAGVVSDYQAATELSLPMTVGAGLSTPLLPSLRLAAEVEWRQWSEAQGTMPFLLSDGGNANLNLMMNGDPGDASFEYPFPLHWQDAWTVKVGLEHEAASGLAVRGGFLYGENPVPDNTVFIAFPAIATNALTLGATLPVGGLPLDVSLVHALNHELDGCGEQHLNGAEYLNSTSGLAQTVITVGLRRSF